MVDWIVWNPIQAGIIGLGIAAIYFYVIHLIEKKIRKNKSKRGTSPMPLMDIATVEYDDMFNELDIAESVS